MMQDTERTRRSTDTPRDKPRSDRVEHANLERPGARAHPQAARRGPWEGPAAWRAGGG